MTTQGDPPDRAGPGPVETWRTDGFAIDPERILRVQGYRDAARIRPRVRKIAERIGAEIAGIARPDIRYRRCPIVSVGGGVLELAGGYRFTCAAFDRLLGEAEEVVVFIMTLGADLEDTVAARFEASEPVDGLFLEAGGWLTIERATRMLAAHINQHLKPEGLAVTFRLGPGYDYKSGEERAPWGLEEQPILFSIFEDTALPVSLLESCAMTPKLSRSGLFGIARKV